MAFSEEPQLTDQEVLKAWGVVSMEVQQMYKPSTLEEKQLLTDEELDQINAGGNLGGNSNLPIGKLSCK
jgi:hypothetical protein